MSYQNFVGTIHVQCRGLIKKVFDLVPNVPHEVQDEIIAEFYAIFERP